jgi:hypothetical protein
MDRRQRRTLVRAVIVGLVFSGLILGFTLLVAGAFVWLLNFLVHD